MKVLQINSVCGIRSTGRIVTDIYKTLKENGHSCLVAYGREHAQNIDVNDTYKIGSEFDVKYHGLMSRITDRTGFYSKKATKKLIDKIEEYKPDIIQLHNVHGYYINVKILFEYLSKKNIPVFWTLHDCWPFTGHCAYYDYVKCNKWKEAGCSKCTQIKEYPSSYLFDNSKSNYTMKKELFTKVENLNLIAVSQWIAEEARNSFLGQKNIFVINNGIDLSCFKPTASNFREKHGLENKRVILGVANVWDRRKGYDTFLKLSTLLKDDERIVLVGLQKKQLADLPSNITGITKTDSVKELAEIYTAADVFVNPTLEDNFPTTNLEAQACGTPVITYKTGGSPECITEKSGIAVPVGDIEALIREIRTINLDREDITKNALNFNKFDKYKEYINLYSRYLND